MAVRLSPAAQRDPHPRPNGCWVAQFTLTFTTSFARADVNSDFLLFMPATAPDLRQVMSYYQETHHINPEGDVLLSDDTIYGLGIYFLHSLFGSIFLVARTPPLSASAHAESFDSLDMAAPAEDAFSTASQTLPPRYDSGDLSASVGAEQMVLIQNVASVLIGCFPDIEYFVAGGIAGIGTLPRECCRNAKAYLALTCSLSYIDRTSRSPQSLPHRPDQRHQRSGTRCQDWTYRPSGHGRVASTGRSYERALAGWRYAQSVRG
jgi:hypothetical protein